jgi:hypothetical protein
MGGVDGLAIADREDREDRDDRETTITAEIKPRPSVRARTPSLTKPATGIDPVAVMAPNASPRVHVTFHPSGAGSLVQALQTLDRDEEVLWLADDLSVVPIAPGDVRQRMQWAIDEIGCHEEPAIEGQIVTFWERVTSLRTEVVAWISSRSVSECCGLFELLWRAKDTPISVVDVADVTFARRDGSPSPTTSSAFSCVPDAQIVEKHLYDHAIRVSDIERERHEAEWRRLRRENAPVRALTAAGVVSVPIDHFDDTIRSFITAEWRTCASIVGQTLETLSEGRYCQCSSHELLFDRLLSLIDDEVVEGKNEHELWSMHDSWVRRKP